MPRVAPVLLAFAAAVIINVENFAQVIDDDHGEYSAGFDPASAAV